MHEHICVHICRLCVLCRQDDEAARLMALAEIAHHLSGVHITGTIRYIFKSPAVFALLDTFLTILGSTGFKIMVVCVAIAFAIFSRA